jgi:DNA-binding response OmpR family regulator
VIASTSGARPIVLVVDDDPAILTGLARIFLRHGLSAELASTVAAAMTIAQYRRIDAVVLDISLRGNESGLNLLALLRQHPQYTSTPVCVLTGRPWLAEDEEEEIRRHGAYIFYKPLPYDELVTFLKRVVSNDHESLVDPDSTHES